MKNWTKKGAVAALSVALSLSLMACSAGQQTPEEVIQGAREKMEAVQSMSYEMTTDLQMSMAGQSIPMTMTGVADFIAEPMAMHMDMTMDMARWVLPVPSCTHRSKTGRIICTPA